MDLTWLSALIVGAALGFCIGTRRSKPVVAVDGDTKNQSSKAPLEIEKLADILDDFKMVFTTFVYLFISFTAIETQEDVELTSSYVWFCLLRFWL